MGAKSAEMSASVKSSPDLETPGEKRFRESGLARFPPIFE